MHRFRSSMSAFAVTVLVLLAVFGTARAAGASAVEPPDPDSPYGSNNWACRPTAAHPYPVILVHGTYSTQKTVFDYLSWYVSASGYCVFSLDYGFYGTDPVAQSAADFKVFVDKVLAATGASKVSIIGHSQGGTMPRYYVKYLGGASKVDDLIGIVPGNHGTSWTGLLNVVPGFTCLACEDLMTGSPFLTVLNAGDEAPGDVSYTNIVTRYDTVVVPYTSGYLTPAPNVTNIRIQDDCAYDTIDHVNAPKDPAIMRIALDALSHAGPANPSYRPKCTW